ncbi:DUF943 family protein [Erwinia oleae]|uniref:DUF943 family protein n=1 Tax=Erwinia oleae TaxID=796334 RepID=UPI000689A9DC|nr:DUF943 family protein [Erwinia oleae]
MKLRKIIKTAMLLIAITASVWCAVILMQPVEIIAVHRNNTSSYIIVKNFPLMSGEKIKWWKENEHLLKENYHIPEPDDSGIFTVIIYDYGDGYQELKPDPDSFFPSDDLDYLICFKDMPVKANCIRKENSVLHVGGSNNGTMYYWVDGASWYQTPGGPLVKEYQVSINFMPFMRY